MTSHRVAFIRTQADTGYFEIKDPSIVRAADGTYYMFASLGTEEGQPWMVGRFRAQHPGGPWEELPPAKITGVAGAEVLAPAMLLRDGSWEMFIQTTCFSKDGVIACARSVDGLNFKGDALPAMAKENVREPVVSLYDVAISEVTVAGKDYDCMTFSGYRSIGNGDVYVSLRERGAKDWSAPKLALKQEDVPFHNKPGSKDYEWGLEGAKVVQLADDAYLMVGVAFLDKSTAERGTRQRVFFAASDNPLGPFHAVNTPIEPTKYPEGTGENGHPDTVDMGGKLGILYQERAGEGFPWHLRYTEMDKAELLAQLRAKLHPSAPRRPPATPKP